MKNSLNLNRMAYLIKPASSSCNLRCPYCFYMDVCESRGIKNYGKMTQETVKALVKGAFEAISHDGTILFAFQGGEPTLVGLLFYQKFIQCVDEFLKKNQNVKIEYSIQTNGTTLNDSWIQFLKINQFLVGISLDGFQENTDKYRIDIRGIGQYHLIMKTIEKLKKANIEFNILTVLTQSLSEQPEKLYEFYKSNKLNFVQIIPCLPNLEGNDEVDALDPHSFAKFYKTFFDLWYEDYKTGNFISIGLFENVIPMYLGISPSQCGILGKCAPQFVIEGDGSVYPCDFYVLDEYLCGNVNSDSVQDLFRKTTLKRFLSESNNPSQSCKNCPFKSMCHGNCKRQNVVLFNDQGYCGYQEFLSHTKIKMIKISEDILQRNQETRTNHDLY